MRAIISAINDLISGCIRTIGFFSKELITVLRQPRLLGGLVLGPFVILLLFGIGFRGQQPEFDTVLVVPNDPSISDDPALYRDGFAGVFKLREVTRDEAQARRRLENGRADVVVIVPGNVLDQIYGGKPAALPVLYNEADPTESNWVKYFAYVQTTELNRRILAEVVRQSKGPASQAIDYAQQSRAEIDGLDADVRAGNYPSAAARAGRLLVATQTARQAIGRSLDALSAGGTEPTASAAGQVTGLLLSTEQELVGLQADLVQGPLGAASAQRRVQNLRSYNGQLDQIAQRVNTIPAETLVSPFVAEAENVLPVEPTPIAFYTPAVLALLLQHIGVTLSALSSVRDRLLGSMELFRVSPVGAGNILLGKSLGYALLLAAVAAALSSAATVFLKVPSLGHPLYYWLSVGLTIFAAVGLGFALATFADSDTQAVQLSMLVLLASVFFGGFFLPLDQLWPQVQALSYLLPVTYGSIDLREVMLRGGQPDWIYLAGPFALGVGFYLLAMFGLRRQMARA